MQLWNETPGLCEEIPQITHYAPKIMRSDAAILMFAGGAYCGRAEHEGRGYAEFFAENGINAFVVDYRVRPHYFPLPLLDARRAIRFVRANAEKYGIDPHKIAVMGSSAGGHLAALVSTYTEKIDFEGIDGIDEQDFIPDAQILCYPVIVNPEHEGSHVNSYKFLLGDRNPDFEKAIDPAWNVTKSTPEAFIWHTSDDDGVNVINSYAYASALRRADVAVEMHIFPHGEHGLGLAPNDPHVAQWSGLLLNWLREKNWLV